MTASNTPYVGVRTEGDVLPASLIVRVAAGDKDLQGSRPEDYHLAAAERLGDAASRKWLYLRGAYLTFRERLARLPETDPATTETREHWLLVLLAELGFGRVPFVRGGLPAGDKTYPVSHVWEHVPVHLLGWHTDLDRRSTKAGRPPQSMLQEFLNVSDDHLWGLLSNGRRLRLIRDSNALTGSSYVEFDLEAIFDGELYSDFLLLFALLHESRFELLSREDGSTATLADCWLERWRANAVEAGTRAMDQLRDSVKRALEELGTGFLEANPLLREQLAHGELTRSDFRHELLRLAYQLIFLFVAEDRNALFESATDGAATDSYRRYFSASRLRRIARLRRGDRNTDLWRTLVTVFDALGGYKHQPAAGLRQALRLPILGGLFFRPELPNDEESLPPDLLRDSSLRNERLLSAIRQLDEVRDRRGRQQRIDYLHLGGEELGSVYESLLELEPRHDPAAPRFLLAELPGNARKTTGSYYTPRALIDTLLDSTLDPLIDRTVRSGVPADLLKLSVCDPACGSGQFLVTAARRIAKRYAAMVAGDEEPPPRAVTDAMHDVVEQCVYGVDMNPLAAEMAKISLWIESLTPGKPLVFLDSRIKVGNSLLGVTPKLLEAGLPDVAFKPIEGDDPKVAASLRIQNQKENGEWVQLALDDVPGIRVSNARLAARAGELAALPVLTLDDIRDKARRLRAFQESPDLRHDMNVANAWCAAFVWRKHADAPEAITTETLRKLDAGEALPGHVQDELDLLAQRYRFFHWHLEFPDIFRVEDSAGIDGHDPVTGWKGGFDCVVGNPPWERVKLQEQEFFAARRDDIADAANAAERKRMIKALATSEHPEDRKLYDDFRAELRQSAGWSHLLRESGRYPLTGRGDINTYAVFAETARTIVAPSGRTGLVLPTGIATDATTAPFFGDVVRQSALVALLEFENEAFLLSRAVDHSIRFCLLAICGRAERSESADFAFGVRYIADLLNHCP